MGYLRLRQICLVASDLAAREAEVADILGMSVCFRDPGVGKYGLQNALFTAGGTFLEIVSPKGPDTAAGRYLQRRKGDGGYMFIVDCDDLERRRDALIDMGVRIVEDLTAESPYAVSEAIHLHPKDTGGCLLSIDRHSGGADLMGGYHWAGPDWQSHPASKTVRRVVGATIQCERPDETAERWADLLDCPAVVRPNGAHLIRLDEGFARFVPLGDDRGEGLVAVHLDCIDRRAILAAAERAGALAGEDVRLAGVRFVLEG